MRLDSESTLSARAVKAHSVRPAPPINARYNENTPQVSQQDSNTFLVCCGLHVSTSLKMWILPLVGYLGVLLGFGFLTLAIGRHLP